MLRTRVCDPMMIKIMHIYDGAQYVVSILALLDPPYCLIAWDWCIQTAILEV